MAIWDDIITERDRQVYSFLGKDKLRIGFGLRPALVLIDCNYNWVGDRVESVLESIKRYPASCGEEAWEAIRHIASILPLVRQKRVPVFYSTGAPMPRPKIHGYWPAKLMPGVALDKIPEGNTIVREIASAEGEVVIYKLKPSIFFGTPFLSYLIALQIDTLLFCGGTTSGCVRASVIDAYSYNYRAIVIQEGTFDRAQASHKLNLFDMHAKYADVVSIEEVKNYLSGL